MSSGQNGRIIGTIVGAVVGYFTAGVGWGLGAAIGGAAGSLLDPKQKVEGPRLDDLKVQRSEYGTGVPTLYATERISPNIIWSTDKLEVANTSSQGKGGGVEQTSFKYYIHMRLMLCETPPDGSVVSIVKIFQDGKLLWDASSGTPIGSALASEENLYASFILYQGDEDQLPNPEEETWLGVGNVPAYRGVVSIYMRAIECVAGRIPQFSFALSTNATIGSEDLLFGVAEEIGDIPRAVMAGTDVVQMQNFPSPGSPSLRVTPIIQGAPLSVPNALISLIPANTRWPAVPVSGNVGSSLKLAIDPYSEELVEFAYGLVNLDTGAETILAADGTLSDTWVVQNAEYAAHDESNGVYMLKDASDVVLIPNRTRVALPTGYRGATVYGGFLWAVTYTSSKLQLVQMDLSGSVLATFENPIIMGTGPVVRIQGAPTGMYVSSINADGSGHRPIWKVSGGIWTVLTPDTTVGNAFGASYGEAFITDTYALIGPSNDGAGADEVSYHMVRFNAVTLENYRVSDIIADQCDRAGETRYDVSAIPDAAAVRGYKIAGPASARTNIDPLLTAFDIFVVDEDGLIKFKMREDITSLGTVTFDELGQSDSGDFQAAMPLTRTQEIDFPRSITGTYIEPEIDYQQASETAIRQVTDATEDQGIAIPVALLSSDQMRTCVERMLYAAWSAQNTRAAKLSRKFAWASPGDGLTFEYPQGSFKLHRVGTLNDTGVLLEMALEPGDAEIFQQVTPGSPPGRPGQIVVPLSPSTRLDLFDMPILRDADNDAGTYAALTPLALTGWRGASLLISSDNINFQDRGNVSRPAVSGFAETVLPSGTPWTIDHSSKLTVSVGEGELNTVTWDEIFADGTTNLAALKAQFTVEGFPDAYVEIFQFRVATSLGGGRYELSEFVRCMYGTERVSFNHGIGDRFLLLEDNGILRASLETGAIGSNQFFKAVSMGTNPDSVASLEDYTAGFGLKPLSPVNVKLDRTPTDGSVVFTWGRRTRFSHNAIRSIMPLGETAEAYDVVIFSDGTYTTVVNVYRVFTTTFVYTSAQLGSDGKTQSGSIPYRIYQISDAVGRGVPFQPGQGIP